TGHQPVHRGKRQRHRRARRARPGFATAGLPPFVIENKPGGGGTIGPAMVAKAEPDGYTALLHSSSLSSQVVLQRTLPYDPIRDFAPVAICGSQPNVLVAAPATGIKTVADLVAAAKARPGALTYASAGIGSASHMAAERLRLAAGINVQHIPFRGAEGMAEVMAGRTIFISSRSRRRFRRARTAR